jgi:hypothetical protein
VIALRPRRCGTENCGRHGCDISSRSLDLNQILHPSHSSLDLFSGLAVFIVKGRSAPVCLPAHFTARSTVALMVACVSSIGIKVLQSNECAMSSRFCIALPDQVTVVSRPSCFITGLVDTYLQTFVVSFSPTRNQGSSESNSVCEHTVESPSRNMQNRQRLH